MNRILACPWQKVITAQKKVFKFEANSSLTDEIKSTVEFGRCIPSCPFYDDIGNYCRRINNHD